jgi:hypothetical protein
MGFGEFPAMSFFEQQMASQLAGGGDRVCVAGEMQTM